MVSTLSLTVSKIGQLITPGVQKRRQWCLGQRFPPSVAELAEFPWRFGFYWASLEYSPGIRKFSISPRGLNVKPGWEPVP